MTTEQEPLELGLLSVIQDPKALRQFPMSTAAMVRVPMFYPEHGKAGYSEKELVFTNNHGTLKIRRGLLTLTHLKLIEAITKNAKLAVERDGAICFFFHQADVLRDLGHNSTGSSSGNKDWLAARLDEMAGASVQFHPKSGKFELICSSVLRKYGLSAELTGKHHVVNEYEKDENGRVKLDSKGKRVIKESVVQDSKLWMATFESEFAQFFRLDLGLRYPDLTEKLNHLRYAISGQIARYALSNNETNRNLKELVAEFLRLDPEKMSVLNSPEYQKLNRSVQHVLKDKDALAAMGIELRQMQNRQVGVFFQRSPQDGVYYLPPASAGNWQETWEAAALTY